MRWAVGAGRQLVSGTDVACCLPLPRGRLGAELKLGQWSRRDEQQELVLEDHELLLGLLDKRACRPFLVTDEWADAEYQS